MVHLERSGHHNTGKQKQHKKEKTQTPTASKKEDQRHEHALGHEYRENPKNAWGQKRPPEKKGRAAKRAGSETETAANGNKKQNGKKKRPNTCRGEVCV